MHDITFQDCAVCQKCCIFSPSESCEAPLVALPHKNRTVLKFPGFDLTFLPVGALWQLQLVPGSQPNQRRCPLHDPVSGTCLTHNDKPLNCRFYPFFVMRTHGRVGIAYTPLCPVVHNELINSLLLHLGKGLGEMMYRAASQFPDLILESRPEALFLCEIERFRPIDKPAHI